MYEYLYTHAQYRRSLIILCMAWAADFAARMILFSVYGDSFVRSTGNMFLISFSGVAVGLIIRTVVLRKKSIFIPEPLPEVDKNIDEPVS